VAARRVEEIFSQRSVLQTYLRVEAALASAEAELNIVPTAAARFIADCANVDLVDIEALQSETKRTGYPIAPLVRQFTAICGKHGRYVHWGATTQDILNTALALQVNEAFDRYAVSMRAIVLRLVELAHEHRNTVMVARTFGGHALPTTFGFKVSVWLSGILRHAVRLEQQLDDPLTGELGGVAGTLASFEGRGLEVRRQFMRSLALPEPDITWSAMRDGVVQRVLFLAVLSGTLAKVTQDIADLASTEIGELAEPTSGGKDASSALPFKANPIYCAQVTAGAALVAQHAATTLQAMRQHQERSAEGLLEFKVLPVAFVEAERCLEGVLRVLRGLRVFPDRMRRNLNLTHGIILAERFMMALAPHIGRLAAHDLVHNACSQALADGVDLPHVLAQMPEVTRHVSGRAVAELGEPSGYLGNALEMNDRVCLAAKTFLSNGRDQ